MHLASLPRVAENKSIEIFALMQCFVFGIIHQLIAIVDKNRDESWEPISSFCMAKNAKLSIGLDSGERKLSGTNRHRASGLGTPCWKSLVWLGCLAIACIRLTQVR